MLNQTTLEALALASGLNASDLKAAIQSEEEKSLEVKSPFKSFSEDDWTQFQSNIDLEKKAKYDEGKTVGSESTQRGVIRELKEKVGLDYESVKPEEFISKFKAKVLTDADKNPDEQVKQLTQDLEDLRKNKIPTLENEKNTLLGQIKSSKIDGKIQGLIPTSLPKGMTKDDALVIVKNSLVFDVDEDGKEVVKKGDEILKNDMRENLGYSSAISDFATERGWRGSGSGGNGDGDDDGSGGSIDHKTIRTMTDMEKYFDKKGIHATGSEASKMIIEAEKAAKEAGEEFKYE